MRSALRPVGPRTPSRRTTARALLAAALTGAALAAPLALAAGPRQEAPALFLPDLQAELKPQPGGLALVGQEGLGNAVIDVQNVGEAVNAVSLELWPKTGTAPATLTRSIPPRGVERLDLAGAPSATGGFYAGRLSGGAPLGGTARVRWVSGAVASYEAAPAATDLILPLVARAVYSHTTIIYAQNADPGPGRNGIALTIFDAETGTPLVEAVADAEAGETYGWDTAHAHLTFGPAILGRNAPTGGWLGHAWFRAAKPFAVQAYGDEMSSQGSSAYVARPIAASAAVQYAPLVRCNYAGDSLIAIANVGGKTASVTIDYQGAAFSPSGSGQTFTEELQIGPRGAVFVDLSERGRGTRPAPALPRGSAPDGGFVGSARITSSGPVLAVVQEEELKAGRVDSVSAYNAFGPADLGVEYSATSVRKAVDYQSTVLYVHNPGYATIDVGIGLRTKADATVAELDIPVPPGDVVPVSIADVPDFPAGVGRALLSGTGAFSALVYDERDEAGAPSSATTIAHIRSLGESFVSGIARLTERGSDLIADLELNGTVPAFRYSVGIYRGECIGTKTVVHDLIAPVEGKSTTTIRNKSIADFTAVKHCILVEVATWPGRPPRDVACGPIDPMAGAEVVDTTIFWPVRLKAGDPIAPPTTPPPTQTATVTPSPTKSSSTTPVVVRHLAYLPLADNRP